MNPFPPLDSQVRHVLNRRAVLRVGGLGLLGLTLPRWAQAADAAGAAAKLAAPAAAPVRRAAARAKSVIFLFQWGGPSQLETFDMKPEAPEGIRGLHRPIDSNVPGLRVNERLPRMAKVMDKVCLVRSVHHTMRNHNSAAYYALTGHAPPVDDIRLKDSQELFPAYGSVVDRLAPLAAPELPTSVAFPHVISDGSITPGQHASFLGRGHDPFLVRRDPNAADFALPELSLPSGISYERLAARRELQQMVDRQSRLLDHAATARGLDAYYDKALAMLHSDRLRGAFNLAAEPESVRERYGRTSYGQSCLLARRLVEAGVKFTTVYFDQSIGGQSLTEGGWDTHGFNNTRMFPIIEARHLPLMDQTLPTLLTDLDERGLLDSTLVVWMGEFGRTPKINGNISRDHWPDCYTVLFAGGGTKRGFAYGASDRHGAYPAENMVRPDDIAATMYHLLGIDPATEVQGQGGRPVSITSGRPILEVMA
jgi:hypothetical protein